MNWILAISYWLHLLTTVVWLGGLVVMALIAFPAWFQASLSDNQWFNFQSKLTPYVNASMAVLWITGFYQMTVDVQYTGFLAIDSSWAVAILLKHVAVIAMTGIGLYSQFRILPAFERIELLQRAKPKLAAEERARVQLQEGQLLRVNLVCAVLVLLFTAIATAM
ncbi:MAG: CopD family protein [Candidatus Promineifilaceae bacterium]